MKSSTLDTLVILTFASIAFWSNFESAQANDTCTKWFSKSKIKSGTNCLLECVSMPVDLGTLGCHAECSYLCESSGTEDFIFKISDLYPGLTEAERAIVAQDPMRATKAYSLSLEAEEHCHKVFPSSRTNDESDACRHFMWAGLLYAEFGHSFSEPVLNAHEVDSKQPLAEKQMDLANNRQGLAIANFLKKTNNLNGISLLREFESNLKGGKLKVLKKRKRHTKTKGETK